MRLSKYEILNQRAKAISKEHPKDHVEKPINVVVFLLDQEKYAIEFAYIREMYFIKEITPLPGAPPFIAGILNVRRKVLPVVDLKVLLDLSQETKPTKNLSKILILSNTEIEFAILTDEIDGVQTINSQFIQAPLPSLTGVKQAFLKGIIANHLIILDGGKLLRDKRMVIQETL